MSNRDLDRHLFVKKTEKTPFRELDVARRRMKEVKHD